MQRTWARREASLGRGCATQLSFWKHCKASFLNCSSQNDLSFWVGYIQTISNSLAGRNATLFYYILVRTPVREVT